MASLRLFFGIGLEPAAVESLGCVQQQLRRTYPDARWVRPDLWHVTLKFLGQTASDMVSALEGVAKQAARGCAPGWAELGDIEAKPGWRRPRVLWVACTLPPAWIAMQAELERLCAELGFPVENRDYRAHVTLARLEQNRPIAHAPEAAVLSSVRGTRWRVDAIRLYRSQPGPSGSQYEILHVIPIGS